MKDRLKVFGLLALYWIIFFIVGRLVFLLYHHDQTALLSFTDLLTVFFLGLRMDLAMTGYWLILPGLFLSIPVYAPRTLSYIIGCITIVLLFISCVIVTVDLELYSHWGFRMNTTPLFYISSEAMGSVNPTSLIYLILLLVAMFAGFCYLYYKWISPRLAMLIPLKLVYAGLMLLVTVALILPIRSSISVAPLNSGVVFFHKTLAFPNHAGINVTWNFFNSLVAQDEAKYPADFYPGTDAQAVLREMVKKEGTSTSLIGAGYPNVIIIILESFTANIIEPLGGLPGITPQLNGLVKEGILFDNFYASGDRTDKGLVAILSGYPAQPLTSIIKFPEKTAHLPFVSREFEASGYNTSFVYGGDIGFANMESYLTTAGFAHIIEDDDFHNPLNTKWGVPDHLVFQRLLEECKSASTPFFKVMLSLSSHEPFDVPMAPVIAGTDERSMFLNACYYTDKSLGEFIAAAKKEPWWNNTLIVITADHGHHYPENAAELKDKTRFRIPMLWLGGAVTKRDTVIHTFGGQTDIAPTLLGQQAASGDKFIFGKDLLHKDINPFAIYIFHNGYGYVDPTGETVYDFELKDFLKKDNRPETVDKSRAYMQVLFDDYNSR